MLKRFNFWFWEFLRTLSQVLGTWIRGWSYVWLNKGKPDSNETTSSWVGRNAIEGDRWALVFEAFIDFLFWPGHCRDAASRRE